MSTGRTRPPSPPWHGALFTASVFGGAAWLLVYTLLPVRPVDALGAWNYLGVLGLLVAATLVVARWRGDR
jgi:Cell division protein CrgA